MALAPVPGADAVVEPGIPLPVAPGVPAHGRAWELITSEDPNGALPLWAYAVTDEKMVYGALGQLPGSPLGEPLPAPIIAARGAAGWLDTSFPMPVAGGKPIAEPRPVAFEPSLAGSIWKGEPPSGGNALYRRDPAGAYSSIASNAAFAGASSDLGHVVFTTEEHLLPADSARTTGRSLYEAIGSTLRLVDVDGSGSPISSCGAVAGSPNGISDDGRRVFFTARPGCEGPTRVYLRSDGATTTEISAPQCDAVDCGPAADASFVGATPDGSAAFLLTEARLTEEDADSLPDLYRYDVPGARLTLVTGGPAPIVPAARRVYAFDNDPRVYFRGFEELEPNSNSGEHLFLADGGSLTVIPGVEPDFREVSFEVSPGGRYVVFQTFAALTGDGDNSYDVYRYDAQSGELVRVSAGEGGRGDAEAASVIEGLWREQWPASHPYRSVSPDGSRILFMSPEQLVPEDHNEVLDVYEWSSGDLGLVSAGTGQAVSVYVGMSPDGGTAIIETADTLVPRDRDGGDFDYYAARIGGGFAEPAPPAECAGLCGTLRPSREESRVPATARRARPRIELAPIGAIARRRAAASGILTLLAEVPQRGRLSAAASARIGRRLRTVAATSTAVPRPGPVRLRLRFSGAAMRQLQSDGELRLRIRLRLSGLASVRRIGAVLRADR